MAPVVVELQVYACHNLDVLGVAGGTWWKYRMTWTWLTPPRIGDEVIVCGIRIEVQRVTWNMDAGFVMVLGS